MIDIYVDASGKEYPECPLRTDLNSCGAVKSKINDCPTMSVSEDWETQIWSLPNYCPLRNGGVCIRFQKERKYWKTFKAFLRLNKENK